MSIERLFIFLLLVIATRGVAAQNQSVIDSLQHELNQNLADTAKVKVLTSVAMQYKDSNPSEGLKYANRAELLAIKIKYKTGLAEVYHTKALLLAANGQPILAHQYHVKELNLSDTLNNGKPFPVIEGVQPFIKHFGNDTSVSKQSFPNRSDERAQVLQMLLQSLRRNSKAKSDTDASQDLKNIAEANELLGNYEEALKYHQMYEQVKDSLSESVKNSQLAERNTQLKNDALELEKLKVHQGNVERIFLISGIVLLLILSAITYSRFIVKKRSNKKLEQAYHELRDTQQQLVQQEKLASLGQLTAGIAHEIRNPLNFVNNFSESSEEILDELKVATSAEERNQLIGELKKNLEKISHHGKRANSIVNNMLNHSRTSSGGKQLTEVNQLCDEFFVLAYQGMKANFPGFNCKLVKNFSPDISKVEIVPQDVSRVLLNLFNNSFYAVNEKSKTEKNYEPTVSLTTQALDHLITISVRDNGNGIPDSVIEKIFEPFFTTKPAGQGTGLGLSISYDIVKAHGGEMKIKSKENQFTEFILTFPV